MGVGGTTNKTVCKEVSVQPAHSYISLWFPSPLRLLPQTLTYVADSACRL